MKAEERKQLEQNSLTRVLGEAVEGLKSGPSPYVWYVVGAVALVVLIIVGWWWYSHEQNRVNSELWTQIDNATSDEALKAVAEGNRDTTQANVADLQRARVKLRTALKSIYTPGDYSKYAKELEEAATLFEKSAREFDRSMPVLAQESLLGAGQAHEARGEFDKAKDFYSRAVAKDEKGVYAAQAREGLQRIEKQGERLKEVNRELNQ